MLTTLEGKMIFLFMILYTTVASLINGTSPLTSTMNLLGYEPLKSDNSSQLNSTALSTAASTVKKKSPDILPKQKNYVTKHITSCPDVGYFFKREKNSVDASQCYLCFCTDPRWAICWPRENQRCDNEHYHHHGVGKRDIRTRRSPGFTDIFFRDAKNDIFNKNTPEQCKPHESSFSEGCPPADWCIGCTVCDCDSNGRWDCHTLSFCPDQETKKSKDKLKKHRDKHLRRNKKKAFKERESSQKKNGKINSKIPKKISSESKTATVSDKNIWKNKTPHNVNKPAKKKFKKKSKYEISESKATKNTTQVVNNLTKRKRDIKKNAKKLVVSKHGAKNNVTVVTQNPSKKNTTITKNKPTKIKSVNPKTTINSQPKKNILRKKAKPIRKGTNPKKTTEAKANLKQSLKQNPKRNPALISETYTNKTKLTRGKNVHDKHLKAKTTNKKKIQTIENIKKQKSLNNKKKKQKYPNDMKLQEYKKNNQAKTKNFRKATNSTAVIRQVKEKKSKLRPRKDSKKSWIDRNGIKYNFSDSSDITKRVKRHAADLSELSNITKINNVNRTIVKNVIDMETFTEFVFDMDKINSNNFTTSKSFRSNIYYLNGTVGDSFSKDHNLNKLNSLTEEKNTENITTNTKSSIQLNETDFSTNPSVDMIKTTTSINVEPTVSLTSYYMYSVDDIVKTTPELNITKLSSTKRSLSEILNQETGTFPTKETIATTASYRGTSVYATEHLNGHKFSKNSAHSNVSFLKYTENSKDLVNNSTFDDIKSLNSEPNRMLEFVNVTLQDLKNKRRKIYTFDLTRKAVNSEKKYRLRKIVHVYNHIRTRLDELYQVNSNKKNITNESRNLLQNFIRKHISLFNRQNSTKRSGAHHVKHMSFLKKFFNKLLTSRKQDKLLLKNDTNSLLINKNIFIQTLCETFGPCYLTKQKRPLINERIDYLSSETKKMFETIKLLKGLFKLLNLDKNYKNQNMSNEEKEAFNFIIDIRKLVSILRDNYVEEEKENLTATELSQINYVKRNFQFFAQSTARFAKTFNDIIDVLTTPSNTSSLTGKYPKGPKIKSEKHVESFQKLKNLLISYKLLQNKFFKKMYEVLGHIYHVQPDRKIYAVDKANKNATLHVYTNNIIKSLRKLKNLAQLTLSKTTTHLRKRRDLRDEESMECLLVIMEYLLKHSYQKERVSDGIDLLIEAIRNAPDIKLIQKQVQKKYFRADNVTDIWTGQKDLIINSSDSKVTEVNNTYRELNTASKQGDSETNNINSMDNESDFDYLSEMNRRFNNELTFTTVVNDYETQNKEQTTEDTAILGLSPARAQTESTFVISLPSSSLKTILLDDYNKKIDNIINGGEDDDIEKRINIFNSAFHDETSPFLTKQKHNIKYKNAVTEKYIENRQNMQETDPKDNMKNDFKSYMSPNMSESKRNKNLDWFDERFGEEVNDIEKNRPLLQTTTTNEKVSRKTQDKDISLSDETYSTKKRDVGSKDTINNKEMSLLNSLDDNFGKSELDSLDIKDF